MPKIVLSSIFTFLALAAWLPAAESKTELNALKACDIQPLAADFRLPAADLALGSSIFNQNGPDPVVITIPGLSFAEIGPGNFELKLLFKLVNFFFPRKYVSENTLAPLYESAMRDHLMLEPGEEIPGASARRVPDNYLEEKLKDLPGYAQSDLIVIPFKWSRDPDDTDKVLPLLTYRLGQIYDAYKGTGRPIYILAHSWGTVLSHTALHRLNASRPDVKIDRWITMGSPLMPGNLVVDLFVKVGIKKEHFEKVVAKPANVRQWRNIWAERDILSNEIAPADYNVVVDKPAQEVEPQLLNLIMFNKQLKKLARKDLLAIRNPADWHSSYFYDYKAYMNSLQKEVFVPVFEPVLAPQITGACPIAPR